jgi:hypothetical protein
MIYTKSNTILIFFIHLSVDLHVYVRKQFLQQNSSADH